MFSNTRITLGYYSPCAVFIVIAAIIELTLGECYFPREWRGSWYQSGLDDVSIHESSFDPKGLCVDQSNDFYLVENSREHCHQCLLIIQRHHNIIQYKESYCVGKDSLNHICHLIRVEAILYTLVRQPSITVPSPFLDAYHFVYNNNSGGSCVNDDNYASQCASSAKFLFRFRQCNPAYVAYTSNRDLEYSCLATWKDGSDFYMYGGFTGPGIINRDQQYRCFMYKLQGTVVYLAMSADSTCRGLRTPQDGPLTLELTKDSYGWPLPNCAFPEWLTKTSWRDLSGRHIYSHDSFGEIMTLTYQRRPETPGHVRNAYRCLKLDEDINSNHERVVTVLSYTSDECDAKLQCLQIIKKRDNVVEVHLGNYIEGHTDRCTAAHLGTFTSRHILIPEYQQSVPCPYMGRYFTERGPPCTTDMRSGCNSSTQVYMTSSCIMHPAETLECLETWKEHNKEYVIMRRSNRMRSPANCFSFTETGNSIVFQADPQCNHGTPAITTKSNYVFSAIKQECSKLHDPPKSSIKSRSDDGGDGYKHSPDQDIIVDNVQLHQQDNNIQSDSSDQSQSSSALSSSSASISSSRTISFIAWILVVCFVHDFGGQR